MKVNKTLKLCLIILIIILLSLISFGGIYVKDKSQYGNKLKEYLLGMDLAGSRRIELEVSDEVNTIKYDANGKEIDSSDTTTEVAKSEEVPDNAAEDLTTENYKLSRQIIEKRLKGIGVDFYEIRQDETNGKIVLNVPENVQADTVAAQTQYQGKFEVIDNDTKEVLMTNDDLESVKAGYGTNSSNQTVVYVNFQFNKEGTKKFKDITNTYIETKVASDKNEETTEETSEENNKTEETTVKKEIAITIDESTLLTTSFDQEIANGLLQLSMGASNDNSTVEGLRENIVKANELAALLNYGKTPLAYTTADNEYVSSEITNKNIAVFASLCISIATVGMIYLVIKYKEKGILSTIALIGYVAILLLAIRQFNVIVTISGLVAIVLSTVLTYIVMIKLLGYNAKMSDKKEAYKRGMIKSALVLIPACVIAIVFTFNNWEPVYSFGMTMFWGIVINLVYNLTITKALLKNN